MMNRILALSVCALTIIGCEAENVGAQPDAPVDVLKKPTRDSSDIVDRMYSLGYSANDIAEAAGVSTSTVYKWKHKKKTPSALRANSLDVFLAKQNPKYKKGVM